MEGRLVDVWYNWSGRGAFGVELVRICEMVATGICAATEDRKSRPWMLEVNDSPHT